MTETQDDYTTDADIELADQKTVNPYDGHEDESQDPEA